MSTYNRGDEIVVTNPNFPSINPVGQRWTVLSQDDWGVVEVTANLNDPDADEDSFESSEIARVPKSETHRFKDNDRLIVVRPRCPELDEYGKVATVKYQRSSFSGEPAYQCYADNGTTCMLFDDEVELAETRPKRVTKAGDETLHQYIPPQVFLSGSLHAFEIAELEARALAATMQPLTTRPGRKARRTRNARRYLREHKEFLAELLDRDTLPTNLRLEIARFLLDQTGQ